MRPGARELPPPAPYRLCYSPTVLIKYLGSKRTLLPDIVALAAAPDVKRVADLFSGTSRVGHALKGAGYEVTSNDHNSYAFTLAQCYVAADGAKWRGPAEALLEELAEIPPKAGWFTKTYCEDARFFQPKNGARVEAIRNHIETLELAPELRAIALVSLMEAADRVDSTCGVQMAYVKKWAKRSHNELSLRLPNSLDGEGTAHCRDAAELASELDVDLVYIDPPYNQHSYRGNYHVWETLVQWDEPETYGIAQKRIDVRTHKSDYNSKRRHQAAFESLIAALHVPLLIVSFSDEAYLPRAVLEERLRARGPVAVVEKDFKRYVGAQIGVHNPKGEKVGTVSHLRNVERMYIAATEHASDAQKRYVQLLM
ncbi:MAG: adenine-specific DNA-methyltransferase [Polyangiales bacterium]